MPQLTHVEAAGCCACRSRCDSGGRANCRETSANSGRVTKSSAANTDNRAVFYLTLILGSPFRVLPLSEQSRTSRARDPRRTSPPVSPRNRRTSRIPSRPGPRSTADAKRQPGSRSLTAYRLDLFQSDRQSSLLRMAAQPALQRQQQRNVDATRSAHADDALHVLRLRDPPEATKVIWSRTPLDQCAWTSRKTSRAWRGCPSPLLRRD